MKLKVNEVKLIPDQGGGDSGHIPPVARIWICGLKLSANTSPWSLRSTEIFTIGQISWSYLCTFVRSKCLCNTYILCMKIPYGGQDLSCIIVPCAHSAAGVGCAY